MHLPAPEFCDPARKITALFEAENKNRHVDVSNHLWRIKIDRMKIIFRKNELSLYEPVRDV